MGLWTPPYVTPVPTDPPSTDPCATSSCNNGPLKALPGGVFPFPIASLPVTIGVLLISCYTWCCVKYRRNKKAHKQWQMDAVNREPGGEVPLVPIPPGVRDIHTHLGGGRMRVGDQYAGTTRDEQLVVEAPTAYTPPAT